MIFDEKILMGGDVYLFKQTSDEDLVVWNDKGEILAQRYDGENYLDLDLRDEFYRSIFDDENITKFFKTFPEAKMYGMYEDRMFKVTDITAIDPSDNATIIQSFEYYQPVLEFFKINYRTPIAKFINPKEEDYMYRCMDLGIWHVKNYQMQFTDSIEITATNAREGLSEEGSNPS